MHRVPEFQNQKLKKCFIFVTGSGTIIPAQTSVRVDSFIFLPLSYVQGCVKTLCFKMLFFPLTERCLFTCEPIHPRFSCDYPQEIGRKFHKMCTPNNITFTLQGQFHLFSSFPSFLVPKKCVFLEVFFENSCNYCTGGISPMENHSYHRKDVGKNSLTFGI